MRFVILGPQGSGKGTQAALLVERFGLAYFSMGEALRNETASGSETGRQIHSILNAGQLVPNEITNRLVEKFVSENEKFIVDGYPRNMEQAEFFDTVADIDAVLVIEVSDDVAVARLVQRGREDDTESAIRTRLAIYHEKTRQVIARYAGKVITVNGDQSVKAVHEEILGKLQMAGLLK